VDFFCHARDLVIEVDGDIHKTQKDYGSEQDKILAGMGLRVLRFSNQYPKLAA
jgi:leucyl-tRNA synthetase